MVRLSYSQYTDPDPFFLDIISQPVFQDFLIEVGKDKIEIK